MNELIVLVDLERTRAGSDWAPPEFRGLERIHWVIRASICRGTRRKPAQLLQVALETTHEKPEAVFQDMDGRSRPVWLNLSTVERESAMIFVLGMVLYCMFEGAAASTNVINQSSAHEFSADMFPDFAQSLPVLRALITKCTAGVVNMPLERIGNKLYGWGEEGSARCRWRSAPHECSASQTLQAISAMVMRELNLSEDFVLARARYRLATAKAEDMEELSYLRRPSLRGVNDARDAMG